MNDLLIVTVYVVLDDLLRAMQHRTDCRAQTSDSEVLTVGVIAACQFHLPRGHPITNARCVSCAPSVICRGRSPSRASIVASTPSPIG